jgi:ABC-type dipeptide/oligopeptide/nickel transport system ATPase component
VPGQAREGERLRLSGDPKSPIDPDQNACRFHGRCPRGQDVCGRAAPPVIIPAPGRIAHCHLPLMEPA